MSVDSVSGSSVAGDISSAVGAASGPVNTLRPYYDQSTFDCGYVAKYKPFQGILDQFGNNLSSKLNIVNNIRNNDGRRVIRQYSTGGGGANSGSGFGGSSSILSSATGGSGSSVSFKDLEMSDFFNIKVWDNLLKQILKNFIGKYFKHLVQQPFDIAKMLMQVGDFSDSAGKSDDLVGGLSGSKVRKEGEVDREEEEEEEEEEEAIDYFQNDVPVATEEAVRVTTNDAATVDTNVIQPEKTTTMDILSSLIDKEGFKGVFKSLQTSFILKFLTQTLDSWFTGVLSPFLDIPDPYFVDLIHSNNLSKSLILSFSASILTGLILLPLDLINTRFIITSSAARSASSPNRRSVRYFLLKWSWKEHFQSLNLNLISSNVLHSCFFMIFNKKIIHTLLILFFKIDKNSGRKSSLLLHNTIVFLLKFCKLIIQLPLETLHRNFQVDYLIHQHDNNPFYIDDRDLLIVKPLVGDEKEPAKSFTNGNGVWKFIKFRNLWNGWKLSLVSLVSGYGLKLLKYSNDDIQEEAF